MASKLLTVRSFAQDLRIYITDTKQHFRIVERRVFEEMSDDDYSNMYGNYLIPDQRNTPGFVMKNLRPLNATSLNQTLIFPDYSEKTCLGNNKLSLGPNTNGTFLQIGDNPPTLPCQTGDARVRLSGPNIPSTSNYLEFCPTAQLPSTSTFTSIENKGDYTSSSWNLKNIASFSNGNGFALYFDPDFDQTGDAGMMLCADQNYGVIRMPVPQMQNCTATGTDVNQSCKWRTDREIFGCCTTLPPDQNPPCTPGTRNSTEKTCCDSNRSQCPTNQILGSFCGTAFMPGGSGSLCPEFMTNVCENAWDTYCESYLNSYRANKDVGKVVQTTVRNYINNLARNTCGVNDYTSSTIGKQCRYTDPVTKQVKVRDDSKDPFISNTLLKLCGTISDDVNNCDVILDQYCAQFTREDLQGDQILQKICGCHLQTETCQSSTDPACNPQGGGLVLTNTPVIRSQYPYPGIVKACDPICSFSDTIQTNGPQCNSTVCIMNNFNITDINSTCGNTNIEQVCGDSYGGKATGNCYISNLDINMINSECGGVFLSQNCGACFSFDPGTEWNGSIPAGAKKVDCSNPKGDPSDPSGPGGGGTEPGRPGSTTDGGGFYNFIEDHFWYLTGGAFLIIFIIFAFMFFMM